MDGRSNGRILVIRLSGIGDVINVLPALSALRSQRPHDEIWWLVETAAASLLEGHPFLDGLYVLPLRKWRASLPHPLATLRALAECRAFFSRLRSARFDVALDFQGNRHPQDGKIHCLAP